MHTLNSTNPVLLSNHARMRMAQRAIPAQVVDVLLAIGKREHDHQGALRVHVRDKVAKRQFLQALGSERASRYRDIYAVVTLDTAAIQPTLVTVGRLRARAR